MKYEQVGVVGMTLALALGALRCTGTETDNPIETVKEFRSSGCHSYTKPNDGPPPGAGTGGMGSLQPQSEALPQPPTVEPDARYNHLYCITWSRTEDELLFRVRNLVAGCGIHFVQGDARVEGNEIAVGGRNPRCSRSACGNCVYDFEWRVSGVPDSGDLNVSVEETDENARACERPLTLHFSIPEGEPEGEKCGFMNYTQGLFSCTTNGPCIAGTPSPGSIMCTCAEGSRCFSEQAPTEAAPAVGGRCLAECQTDADCALPDSFTCIDGLCHLKPW